MAFLAIRQTVDKGLEPRVLWPRKFVRQDDRGVDAPSCRVCDEKADCGGRIIGGEDLRKLGFSAGLQCNGVLIGAGVRGGLPVVRQDDGLLVGVQLYLETIDDVLLLENIECVDGDLPLGIINRRC